MGEQSWPVDGGECLREKCGLIGIASQNGAPVAPLIIDGLRALQHRGQESWGLAVPNKEPYHRLGLVSEDLTLATQVAGGYDDSVAIGHVRYST